MRAQFSRKFGQIMESLGLDEIEDMPNDLRTTNMLLTQNMLLQKIMIAANNVGIDWETYEVWVEPGERATKIVSVQRGDIVVAHIYNKDKDNASSVWFEQNPTVTPSTNIGLEFPPTGIVAGVNDAFDFNEVGPNFACVLTPNQYMTGLALATEVQTQMNLAGAANTYTCRWIDGVKLFEVHATNAGAVAFNITPVAGPNTATSAARISMGWTADSGGTAPDFDARSNEPLTNDVQIGDLFRHGHELMGGEYDAVVLTKDLYAIQDADSVLRCPISVRYCHILRAQRG